MFILSTGTLRPVIQYAYGYCKLFFHFSCLLIYRYQLSHFNRLQARIGSLVCSLFFIISVSRFILNSNPGLDFIFVFDRVWSLYNVIVFLLNWDSVGRSHNDKMVPGISR